MCSWYILNLRFISLYISSPFFVRTNIFLSVGQKGKHYFWQRTIAQRFFFFFWQNDSVHGHFFKRLNKYFKKLVFAKSPIAIVSVSLPDSLEPALLYNKQMLKYT